MLRPKLAQKSLLILCGFLWICQKMHVLSKYGKLDGERRMMKHYMKSADCMMLFVLIQSKKAMMYKRKIQSWKITG
nr:uncharacterized protein LOC109146962 [Ipomoea batatas]